MRFHGSPPGGRRRRPLSQDEINSSSKRIGNIVGDAARTEFNDFQFNAYSDRQVDRNMDIDANIVDNRFEKFEPEVTRRDLSLDGSLGDNADNFPREVFAVKKVLSKAGVFAFDPANEPTTVANERFTTAIRNFQAANDLKVDGLIRSGGPTIHMLGRKTMGQENGRPSGYDAADFKAATGRDPNRLLSGKAIFTEPVTTPILGETAPLGIPTRTKEPGSAAGEGSPILPTSRKIENISREAELVHSIKEEDLPPLPQQPSPGKTPTSPPQKFDPGNFDPIPHADAIRALSAMTKGKSDAEIKVSIKNLSFSRRLQLLDAISKGPGLDDKQRRYLRLIYGETKIMPEYQSDFLELHVNSLAQKLAREVDAKSWPRTWFKLNRTERRELIERTANVVLRHFGLPPMKLEISKDSVRGRSMWIRTGATRRLLIDPKAKAWGDPNKALSGAIHEALHIRQLKLVKDLREGKLKVGHPSYRQAKLWAINTNLKGKFTLYLPRNDDGNKNQPVERSAVEMMRLIFGKATGRLAP